MEAQELRTIDHSITCQRCRGYGVGCLKLAVLFEFLYVIIMSSEAPRSLEILNM